MYSLLNLEDTRELLRALVFLRISYVIKNLIVGLSFKGFSEKCFEKSSSSDLEKDNRDGRETVERLSLMLFSCDRSMTDGWYVPIFCEIVEGTGIFQSCDINVHGIVPPWSFPWSSETSVTFLADSSSSCRISQIIVDEAVLAAEILAGILIVPS
ncbi:hypothetical protein RIR_jg6172.t1 [Rhizophagus irregularis DAOM 181602=DAOM 197198]|nr:hypothetical protein RIR_jg6172.t1 [Rhizophagus irregularis DAOM 181602=DAOM 197198]